MLGIEGKDVRLIASDIDGTILSYKFTETGALSQRTINAFDAARKAGLHVVLVTGRPLRWLKPVSDLLGGLGPVICSNGAVVYDMEKEQLIRADCLPAQALFDAKDLILRIDPEATFAAETMANIHAEEGFLQGSLFFEEDRREAAGITDDVLKLGPLDSTLEREGYAPASKAHPAHNVLKLLVKTHTMDADAFLERVHDTVGHLLTVTHSAPGVSLLELSGKGINKAAALKRLSEGYGVGAEEVAAFGDMPNDIEMLQWAGASWAVGSAHPMARSAAQFVAADCDDDGVAKVIEGILSQQVPSGYSS